MSDSNLFSQQESNRKRTRWLVAGFLLFFGWVGFGGDLGLYLLTAEQQSGYRHTVPLIGIVMTLAAGAICWSSFRKGPARVLWAAGASEVVEAVTPAHRQLANVVEEMAIASGVPVPKIWVVPDPDPNAFATGLDAQRANIAVTEGLLQLLDRDELQAVIAHEMAHIRNLDVRLMTMLAAMVGAIALISDGMGRMLGRGVRVGGGGKGRGGKKGNQLAIIILVLWVLTLLVAPLITRLLAMGVSRKREFLADASAAQFTRNPDALASALEKLDGAPGATRAITRGAAHLCIVDPGERKLSQRDGLLGDIFASHPPIRHRITRLKGMAYQQANATSDR